MRTILTAAVFAAAVAGGCETKKKAKPTTKTTDPTSAPSGGGGGNSSYVSGGGAVQNIRQAARRTVTLAEMKDLGTAITQFEVENGKMPSIEEIKALVRTYGGVATHINDGTIILTGSTDRSGLWAYEIEADLKGGIGLVAGVASRYDAATIKQYLGR